MASTIAVLGTLDTKGPEHAYVAELIRQRGHQTLLIDTGTGAAPTAAPDIPREEVAAAGGVDLPGILARRDRGEAVTLANPQVLSLNN
ncbi:MAG TPA: Tm-1-like ATP-binding domain-containing protein, partial [Prosthecobacter sp.]|nr:Tm-1-like ATP-binding domain-containing protein [Prosthecobacter sp.]